MPNLKKIDKIIFTILFSLSACVSFAQGISIPVKEDGSVSRLRSDISALCASRYAGRRSGTQAMAHVSEWIASRFASLGLIQAGADGWFQSFVLSDGGIGRNVIAKLEGTSGKYIVLASHYDALGNSGGVLYPGANSNASGVAAMFEIARLLQGGNEPTGSYDGIIFVALDAHFYSYMGAAAFVDALPSGKVRLVAVLDTIGASSTPVDVSRPRYLMALGGEKYKSSFKRCASIARMEIYYEYYRSESFTEMFHKRIGDQSVFVKSGFPTLVFTSGVTMDTNKPSDLPSTIDYNALRYRCLFLSRWLNLGQVDISGDKVVEKSLY